MARYGHKEHPDAKHLAQGDLLFGSPCAEEFRWERGQQPCAITTGAIGVDTTAVRETFKRLQGHLEDFIARRSA